MGVELKVPDMQEDAQGMAGGDQLVALVSAGMAAIERTNISRRTKQDLEHARAEGKLYGRRREHRPGADAHHITDEKGPGHVSSPNSPGSGSVGIAGATGFDG